MTKTTNIPALAAAAAKTPAEVVRLRKIITLIVLVLFLVLIPALSAMGVIENHNLNRLARYLCFAIAAIGIDLVWGFAGALSLCQAFFFCIGGYAMAMHLALPEGGGDVRAEYNNIPQFLFFANPDSEELPAFWRPFRSMPLALLAALLVPATVASIFGFFIFRSRVRGVYFSIITQAVAWGAFLAFSRNEMLLGGTNGLTNFYKPLNQEKGWILGLYLLTVFVLLGTYLLCRAITRSRTGRVLIAVRDNESRLVFAGYRPDMFKLFAFCVAAMLAALGGVLYAPQTGIITPNIMKVEDSIFMVIWVALGGLGRLWGAVMGTIIVTYAQSLLTSSMPALWPFIQGGMYILAILLFPDGLGSAWDRVEALVAARASWRRVAVAAAPLLSILLFIFFEGLGLMPAFMSARALGLPLSYWLPITVCVGCGLPGAFQRWRDTIARRRALAEPTVAPILAAKEAKA